ncbi:class I SAM-dependent methyltransferase [Candidatus Pelagibacter sp.]|nr:class I SAM-dependent methyltransferase [Candidatus Pelagibacter sp.]
MEIDLLKNYPKPKRNLEKRLSEKNSNVVQTARKFGKDFFDGDRKYGYGGFSYNPKYWTEVVKDFVKYYKLVPGSKILDVGCAKGFMLYDLRRQFPKIEIAGIDISDYAIQNCHPEIKDYVKVGDAKKIDFDNDYFDLVISINTVHNLDYEDCKKSINEISRVTKKNAFITVDAFNDEEEKNRMYKWNLTAKTIMSVNEWKKTFNNIGYNGNYFWFIP